MTHPVRALLSRLFGSAPAKNADATSAGTRRPPSGLRSGEGASVAPNAAAAVATTEVDPPGRNGLRITYSPSRDGQPDAGEIIWTWVPYDENDGRGKDRPVLVIAQKSDSSVYAVRLTSKPHDADRDFLSIGAGSWDSRGRPSWVDIEQVYTVHTGGVRREASALDRELFARIADALHRRYGWSVEL